MKHRICVLSIVLLCLTALPMSTMADSKTFPPPPKKGTIYVIIKFTKGLGVTPMDHNVSIRWGNWSKNGRFNPGGGILPKLGVVIRLKHSKDDSVPLTVDTEGAIQRIFQGDPPSEWSNGKWHTASW